MLFVCACVHAGVCVCVFPVEFYWNKNTQIDWMKRLMTTQALAYTQKMTRRTRVHTYTHKHKKTKMLVRICVRAHVSDPAASLAELQCHHSV